MKTDKERELWLQKMASQQSEMPEGESAHTSTQKYARWAAVAALGLTTATVVSNS